MSEVTLIDVEIDGQGGLDVHLSGGKVAAIGRRLERLGDVVEGRGGALLPGLQDHHVHIFALAARMAAVSLGGTDDLAGAIQAAGLRLAEGHWLRAVDYEEGGGPLLDASSLDAIVADRPARVQHRTGALWILNSAALARLAHLELPRGAERDADGRPTGRFRREDRWLREHLPSAVPSLAQVAELASRHGITGLTDTSADNDDDAAATLLAAAREAGLRSRLTIMGRPGMTAPADRGYRLGPVKILLDDDRLDDLDGCARTIRRAHAEGRAVAIHCVTRVQTVFALAAWEIAGAHPGDRIEHGSLIDDDLADDIAERRLSVVTQPGFIMNRGDRYLRDVEPAELPLLYRLAGLRRRGVALAGSSDAPYGPFDPWIAMRAAVDRRTSGGGLIGAAEALSPREALGLYLGDALDPAGPPRRVVVGQVADLCLMRTGIAEVLDVLSSDLVAATIVGGRWCMRRP